MSEQSYHRAPSHSLMTMEKTKHILVTNLWEQQCVNTGSTWKYDDGERDDNGEDKTHLHDIGGERGRELGDDVTSYLLFVEGDVAKKPNLQEGRKEVFLIERRIQHISYLQEMLHTVIINMRGNTLVYTYLLIQFYSFFGGGRENNFCLCPVIS